MSDENNGTSQSTDKPSSVPTVEELVKRLELMESKLKDVNQESAERRLKIRELEDEREALRRAQMDRLQQEGNYKAIAEEQAKKLTELQTYQERATALESTIRAANDARIANIPEHLRGIVPTDYSPEKLASWLDANQAVLNRPVAPDLGAGMAGGNGTPIKLSAMQKETAKRFGMTEEQYVEALRKMGQI